LFGTAGMKTGLWMRPLRENEGKVTGEMKQITRGTAFHGQPSVALDGSKALDYTTRAGNMDISVMDLNTGREWPVTSTPVGEYAPLISADGATVLYSIYGKREAWLVSSGGGEATKICEDCGTWNVSHDA